MPLLRAIDESVAWWWSATRKSLESHLALESAAGPAGPLVARDGSLASAWRIDGTSRIPDAEGRTASIARLAARLGPLLRTPGHALQIVAERDPDAGGRAVDAASATARAGAAAAGLDLADVLAERVAVLSEGAARERVSMVAWTRPAALPRETLKRDAARRRTRWKSWPASPGEAQLECQTLDALAPRHDAFAAETADAAAEAGIVLAPLDAATSLGTLRETLNPGCDARGWRPDIPGVPVSAAFRTRGNGSAAALRLPLAEQLIASAPSRGRDRVGVGGLAFAPLDVVLPPRAPRPFSELLARLAGAAVPFRIAFLIEGGGLAGFRIEHLLSSLLAWSDAGTALQREALEALSLRQAEGDAVVRLRITALTWAPWDAPASLLDERRGRLLQALEAWGEMTATPLTGDPLAAFASTAPGMSLSATAEPAAAPLADALAMAPLHHAAPLARSGAHLFLSPGGCPQPFDPAAGEPGLDLIHGVTGRGKSVLMSALSLAYCLGGTTGSLPRLAIVDVGPSARGLIDLLRDALPPERRTEAAWARMNMDESAAVNPFDTPLGCRHPGPAVRALLGNVLSLALAPPGGESAGEGIRDILGAAIPVAYRLRDPDAPGAEPAVWQAGRCPEADAALERHGTGGVAPRTPWWTVVDRLFECGEMRAAELAQRFAVPTASDLISAARTPEVRDLAGEARHRDGAGLVEALARLLTAASARLPILFRPTRFDLAGARVAAVDVAGAAELGSEEARRGAAIAYMLARKALTAGWWLTAEETAGAPAGYRRWHADRFRAGREEPKRLCYDEFHRLEAAPAVIDQVERDAREGRKAGVRVVLASQLLQDFPPRIVEQASRIWTLGAGGRPAEVESLAGAFALSPGAREAVRQELTGPSARGAPVLLLAGSGADRREALLWNRLGPVELWALGTDPLDVALRRRLYAALGPREARRRLAARFASGTAKPDLERRRQELEERGLPATDADALDSLARELAGAAAETVA